MPSNLNPWTCLIAAAICLLIFSQQDKSNRLAARELWPNTSSGYASQAAYKSRPVTNERSSTDVQQENGLADPWSVYRPRRPNTLPASTTGKQPAAGSRGPLPGDLGTSPNAAAVPELDLWIPPQGTSDPDRPPEKPRLPATQPRLPDGKAGLPAAGQVSQEWTKQYTEMIPPTTDDVVPYATRGGDQWRWRLLPKSIIYKSYLAGNKEARLGLNLFSEKENGFLFDGTLGGRVGFLRFGPEYETEGFQIDFAGAAQVRLDPDEKSDVDATDYWASVPLTYGRGNHQFKLAWYHLSSHVGDEFLLKQPGFHRINYSRDVFVLGYSVYLLQDLRVYAETGYAYKSDVSLPWEFQFGFDLAPTCPTGWRGCPFLAMNGHLKEELDYGGNFTLQLGWAWRADDGTGHLLRTGLHYYNGSSSQYSFYYDSEQQLGWGLWYDF